VQIYSVLIYDGPGVVREIAEGLAEKVKASGRATLSEAVAKARTV
jgi:dihydroorotate dehydrogenase